MELSTEGADAGEYIKTFTMTMSGEGRRGREREGKVSVAYSAFDTR